MKNKEITTNQHKGFAIAYFILAFIVLIIIILLLVRGVVASGLGFFLLIYLAYKGVRDWRNYKVKK